MPQQEWINRGYEDFYLGIPRSLGPIIYEAGYGHWQSGWDLGCSQWAFENAQWQEEQGFQVDGC